MNLACIIPFYNEGSRVLSVLNQVSKIKLITQIICVDDGSLDNSSNLIKENFKDVELIKMDKNSGKAAAVLLGAKKAQSNYLLLLDADLQNLNPKEIENAIKSARNNATIDMIILRRINDAIIPRMFRSDVLVSGERILKKADLLKVFKKDPTSYQLEVAINKYMLDNHKKVVTIANSATNYHRINKYGILMGIKNEIKMDISILQYTGLLGLLKQMLFLPEKNLNNLLARQLS